MPHLRQGLRNAPCHVKRDSETNHVAMMRTFMLISAFAAGSHLHPHCACLPFIRPSSVSLTWSPLRLLEIDRKRPGEAERS